MSTREYIGARYVPKFAEPFDWSSTRRYEALEIVYHLGASYTSKKPVPVGIDINNSEYWVLTGNYNAQVQEFRNETARLMADYISLLQNGEKLIGKSWIPNPTPITAGGAILSNPNRVLVIGDSYNDQGRGQYSTYGVTTWGYHLQELFGFDASNYKTIGVSSAGWTCKGTSNTDSSLANVNFEDIVRRFHTPENVYDKVIIVGGLNDIIRKDSAGADVTKVPEAIEKCVQYIKAVDKNTDVYIGVCGYTFDKYQYMMKELVNNVCSANAPFTFLNGVQNSIKGKSFLLNDYLHPTNEAEIRIAKAIYNSINGNDMHYTYNKSYTVKNTNDGETDKTVMTFLASINDDTFKMTTYDLAGNLQGYHFTASGRTSNIEIGEVENYEFTAFNTLDNTLYDMCSPPMYAKGVINNPRIGASATLEGDHECDLSLRWYLKSTGEGASLKTTLNLTLSAQVKNPETNEWKPVYEGTFVSSVMTRLHYSFDVCSSMVV